MVKLTYTEKEKHEKRGKGIERKPKTPSYPHKCSKCGYIGAETNVVSASYSDESDISMYTCKKCGHVDRETDGTGN
jgi:DNA-directed RNA polymerase subunit M/transcription elongation factor TFIIS